MNFFERRYTPMMAKAIKSQLKAFTDDVKVNGLQSAQANLYSIVINTEVAKVVSKIYKEVGVYFANHTYSEIQSQVSTKGFGFNIDWINEIVNYFTFHLLNKAVLPISQTTIEQIRRELIKGEQQGLGVDEIVRNINSSEITNQRARMIVRTESVKAMFKGRELGKSKSPYETQSTWIAAQDHRTRHSHRQMDNVIIPPNEKFVVPVYKKSGKADLQIGVDLMIGPGDITAHKSNLINCRCTSIQQIVFDEQDNPIMKTTYENAL